MREINLETTFKDTFFDPSHHIPDKTGKNGHASHILY